MNYLAFLLAGAVAADFALSQEIKPMPFKVEGKVPDALSMLSPSQIRLEGFLGARVEANARARLLNVGEEEILDGFRHRPGKQDWIGEHVGKFLHAATLAWAYTGDAKLREKIDRVAAELVKCQDADGYLGTYTPDKHWTSWDVWVHKYDLMGLLTYYQYTGNQPALDCCRKIGDLLCSTFGPGKRDVIASGTHVGMAATSVLEPIVYLHRMTGEQKYLDFANYLVASYDQATGPKIVRTLLEVKRVDKTANGKAYEMMSNLVGLCELYRVTGEKNYLQAAVNAWEDIVANHLYITGSVSQGEHFHAPHELPNGQKANVAETCATVTWLQLNAQLLRLTGEAKYAEELERTFYNHLAAAQRPDGAQWCYFTPLTGTKPYGPGVNCCVSSGPRGMAMIPQLSCFKYQSNDSEGIAVAGLELSGTELQIAGQRVRVAAGVTSDVDGDGASTRLVYTLALDDPATFALRVRWPAWADKFTLRVQDQDKEFVGSRGGWVEVPPRQWKSGDRVLVSFRFALRVVPGDYGNKGYGAVTFGPLVCAYDQSANPGLAAPASLALAESADGQSIKLRKLENELAVKIRVRSAPDAQPVDAIFVPFAEAGAKGGRYQVWMSLTNRPASRSLLAGGKERRSRQGNRAGSILDPESAAPVVTFDGKKADEDWFAVTLEQPVTIGRIVYAHGRTFHDGGWFDAGAGRPRIQVQKEKNGAWETVATLDDYPATTAANSKGMQEGQKFTCRLKAPVKVFAVRVIGRPACGDNPRQAFASCGELSAYAK